MTSRLFQVLLALSLLLNAFVLAGFVYRSWIEPPRFAHHAMPPPPPGQRPSGLEMVARDLNLDQDQRQAMKGVFDRYAAARSDRQRETQKLRDQLAAEYKKSTVDMVRVDALLDQLTKLRAEFPKDLLHSLAQIEPQLRPEQRERMHEVLAERLAAPFGHPPPPPPGSPRPPRPPQ